jgi:hypothetical protein
MTIGILGFRDQNGAPLTVVSAPEPSTLLIPPIARTTAPYRSTRRKGPSTQSAIRSRDSHHNIHAFLPGHNMSKLTVEAGNQWRDCGQLKHGGRTDTTASLPAALVLLGQRFWRNFLEEFP